MFLVIFILLSYIEYNNKIEDNSLSTLNDKNYQASSQKY